MTKKKITMHIFSIILSAALLFTTCITAPIGLSVSAESYTVICDYGNCLKADGSNAFNDSVTLTATDGVVTLPENSKILNLQWENGGRIYQPGEQVAIAGLTLSQNGTYVFNAYYGSATIDFENFEEGYYFYESANGPYEGANRITITKDDTGKQYLTFGTNNKLVIAVLFDIINGEKSYLHYNLGQEYQVTFKFKAPSYNVWGSVGMAFGAPDNDIFTPSTSTVNITSGTHVAQITTTTFKNLGYSGTVEELSTFTQTYTAPDTYLWKPDATQSITRKMAVGVSGQGDNQAVYIDEITVSPVRTATFDYDDSETFGDGLKDVIVTDSVTLPANEKILNLNWKNGNSIYAPGTTVNASDLVIGEDGKYNFTAYYGEATVDYEKYTEGWNFTSDGNNNKTPENVLDGAAAGVITKETAADDSTNQFVKVSNAVTKGYNINLFDYNDNGNKAYIHFNRGQQYRITLKYKLTATATNYDNIQIGYGIAGGDKWNQVALSKYNGQNNAYTALAINDEWFETTIYSTAPDSYAWNTSGDSSNSVPNTDLSSMTRKMSIAYFAPVVDGEFYLDDVTVTPINDKHIATFNYGGNDIFDDAVEVEFGKTVTLPQNSAILNLKWKNGTTVYDAGQTVNAENLVKDAQGKYVFNAYYGGFEIDYSNFEADYSFYNETDGIYESSSKNTIVVDDNGNKALAVKNNKDAFAVLFDMVGGEKSYAYYNLGQKYQVTVRFKDAGTNSNIWSSFGIGFGIGENTNTTAISQTAVSSSIVGKSSLWGKGYTEKVTEYSDWTNVVTAPTTYAWNGGTATEDITRKMAIGFAGIDETNGSVTYIDKITVTPVVQDTVTYTIDYGYADIDTVTDEIAVGTLVNTPAAPEARYGFKFMGWYTSLDATEKFGLKWAPNNGDTAYAVWVPFAEDGDVNNDSVFDIRDLVRSKKAVVNLTEAIDRLRADINSDGESNATDITIIRKMLLGNDTENAQKGIRIEGVPVRNYTVVIDSSAGAMTQAAAAELAEEYGIAIADSDYTGSDYEIIIKTTATAENDITVSNNKVIIDSLDDTLTAQAVQKFINYKTLANNANISLNLVKDFTDNVYGALASDYVLTFSEEFNTETLDTSVWESGKTDYTSNTAEGVSIENGVATLSAKKK